MSMILLYIISLFNYHLVTMSFRECLTTLTQVPLSYYGHFGPF